MADIFDLRDDVNAALVALDWTILPTSDYLNSLDSIPVQVTAIGAHYQLQTQYERIDYLSDANVTYDIVNAEVVILVRETFGNERTFTDTTGETWSHHSTARPLLLRSFWDDLSSVFQITAGPEKEQDLTREGNVMVYSVKAELALVP